MKAIFKTVLIVKYTDNKENLDFNSLKEHLNTLEDYPQNSDLEQQIQTFDHLINQLIKDAGSSSDQQLEQLFLQYGFEDEKEIKDMIQVWQNEQDKAYSYLISKNTSHKKIDKIEWSINNKFYGKKAKNLHDITCIVQLKLKDINVSNQVKTQPKFLNFELNENELNNMASEFDRIEDEINNLFGSNQQEEGQEQE